MRTAIFIAGFISAAAAATYTVTETADVTVTSCAPSITDCPAQSGSGSGSEWENISATVSAPISTPPAPQPSDDCTDSDSEWQQWSDTNGASCPAYTATAPPTWISQLPAPDYSSMAAKWSTGPPADWCSYSYTTGPVKTSAAPYPTGSPATTTAVGTGGYKPTTSAYATYTGAASSNAGSVVFAALAVAAALVAA